MYVFILVVYLVVMLCFGVVCCLFIVFVIRINFRDLDILVIYVWKCIYDNILVLCLCLNGCFCWCIKGKKFVNFIDFKDEFVVMNYDGEKNELNLELELVDELKWIYVVMFMDYFFFVVMVIIMIILFIIFMVVLFVGGVVN